MKRVVDPTGQPLSRRFLRKLRRALRKPDWSRLIRPIPCAALRRGWHRLKRKAAAATATACSRSGLRWSPLLLSLALVLTQHRSSAAAAQSLLPYSDFVADLRRGIVSHVLFPHDPASPLIHYRTTADASPAAAGGAAGWGHGTRMVGRGGPEEGFLLGLIREVGAAYSLEVPPATWWSAAGDVLGVVLVIVGVGLMSAVLNQGSNAGSGILSWGLLGDKKSEPCKPPAVQFKDVEGVDAAKVELMEVVSCLKGAANYKRLGAKLPRGLLLVGPPGTGKTLLARAVAGEAGVPFFSTSGSEFVEIFAGRGAARVRALFKEARKHVPSIIFIDEIDAVGARRKTSFSSEQDQTLNQLLTEMDGFEMDKKLIVIAATNRTDVLDPALCRPGRFSRKICVGEPDEDGRRKIVSVHLRGMPLEEDPHMICNLVASCTQGFVGADLANIIHEAVMLAARRGAEKVARADIMGAIQREKQGRNYRKQEEVLPFLEGIMKPSMGEDLKK